MYNSDHNIVRRKRKNSIAKSLRNKTSPKSLSIGKIKYKKRNVNGNSNINGNRNGNNNRARKTQELLHYKCDSLDTINSADNDKNIINASINNNGNSNHSNTKIIDIMNEMDSKNVELDVKSDVINIDNAILNLENTKAILLKHKKYYQQNNMEIDKFIHEFNANISNYKETMETGLTKLENELDRINLLKQKLFKKEVHLNNMFNVISKEKTLLKQQYNEYKKYYENYNNNYNNIVLNGNHNNNNINNNNNNNNDNNIINSNIGEITDNESIINSIENSILEINLHERSNEIPKWLKLYLDDILNNICLLSNNYQYK